ncbi:MAG: DUF423 domain-containing protein [Steroidobacteraceae bacterium]|jgi:uncharacterized membrane protein YgdD (TMEM256/DUF423 family)|nr:DUF423 domain-containing protein [Steroidobacteraceae bacterium]
MNTASRLEVAFAAAGAILLALATALGAIGSHVMAARLDPAGLASWQTAVSFQFWHGLGLFAVAWSVQRLPRSRLAPLAGAVMLGGVLLFSGSILLARLGFTAQAGPAAPIGGSSLILSWLLLAAAWAGARRG